MIIGLCRMLAPSLEELYLPLSITSTELALLSSKSADRNGDVLACTWDNC